MKFVSHFAVKKYAHLKKRTAPAMLAGVALFFAAQTARAQENDHQKNDEDREATPITMCPTTIGKSGKYFLAKDLQGCMPFGISITVSDVAVELRGHTIQAVSTGNVPGDVAILADVGGTTALSHLEIEGPGTVTQGDNGIYFGNVHYSRVRNLVAVQNNTGIAVNAGDLTSDAMIAATASTNNEFSNKVATSNLFDGITVNGGNENRFIRNNLSGNSGNGLNLSNAKNNEFSNNVTTSNSSDGIIVNGGNENRFIRNNLSGNSGNGLNLLNAKNNVVRENTADANSLSGIDIAPLSSGNLVDGNTALGNTTDLVDQSGGCTQNMWTNNSFSPNSNSPPCIH